MHQSSLYLPENFIDRSTAENLVTMAHNDVKRNPDCLQVSRVTISEEADSHMIQHTATTVYQLHSISSINASSRSVLGALAGFAEGAEPSAEAVKGRGEFLCT